MNKAEVSRHRCDAIYVSRNIIPILEIRGMTNGEAKIKSIVSNCEETFDRLVMDLSYSETELNNFKSRMTEICRKYVSENLNINHDTLLTKANKLTQMFVNSYMM